MITRRSLTTWAVSAAMLLGVGLPGEASAKGFKRAFNDRTGTLPARTKQRVIDPQTYLKNLERARKLMPPNQAQFHGSPLVAVSGKVIDHAMHQILGTALAANFRNPLVAEGVLRAVERAQAAIYAEIAKSESTYCPITFEKIAETTHAIADRIGMKHGVVAFHADHYGIKDVKADVPVAKKDIPKMFEKGITSIAIDPSHLVEPHDNLKVSIELAKLLPTWAGLETEVGEIKGDQGLSTVDDAVYQVMGLISHGIFPDLIALNNGSSHGIEATGAGIQVELTRRIHAALAGYGVSGAQHGTSGNADARLREIVARTNTTKANVATGLQMVSWGVKVNKYGNAELQDGKLVKQPGHGLPAKLWKDIAAYGAEKEWSPGDHKKANLVFADQIERIGPTYKERSVRAVEEYAYHLIVNVFGAKNSAHEAVQAVVEADSYDIGPIVGRRIAEPWSEKEMIDRGSKLDTDRGPEGDYED